MWQQFNPAQAELNKWLAYVDFGQYANLVVGQCLELQSFYPNYRPSVESMMLPGMPQPANMLLYKGTFQYSQQDPPIQLKIVLVPGFPFRAPKVYVDQQLTQTIVRSKSYLGLQNEINIPYVAQWNISQSNLKQMITFVHAVIQADPPIPSAIERGSFSQGPSNINFSQFPQQQQSGIFTMQRPQNINPQQNPPIQNVSFQNQNPSVNHNNNSVKESQMNQGQTKQEDPQNVMNFSEENNASLDQMRIKMIDKVDTLSQTVTMSSEDTLNHLCNLKAYLLQTQNKLEVAVSQCKDNINDLQNNIAILEQQILQIEQMLSRQEHALSNAGGSVSQLTPEAVDELVKISDPVSERIIKLTAKYNAIEDCMASVKKAYDKEKIPLSDFLKTIRELSFKQCKQLTKLEKINKVLNK